MPSFHITTTRAIQNYLKIIFSIYAILFIFRIIEFGLIVYNYGFKIDILISESIGLVYDILASSIPIVIYFVFYIFILKINPKIRRLIHLSVLLGIALFFFIVIKYFLYQLEPLDVFLYTYSLQEILFTIKTSDTHFMSISFSVLILIASITTIYWKLDKTTFRSNTTKITYFFLLISLPLFLLIHTVWQNKLDKFSINKPFYFVSRSINYFTTSHTKTSITDVDAFQNLYPNKDFISKSYPLVYKIKRDNTLKKYFNTFKSSPNIVILIVEGLNDDFIHQYKGTMLMPFLNQLKNKSLYWNKCFTLGERSFAVVPSILGGLPYGDFGFTIQERLPRHLSLVSILNTNNYYSSFYDGQGAWFHQKERFFKYNNMDLIFDNSQFSSRYDKIIVGDDHFFWGYNDKDLFAQSLNIIDSLKQDKRLDIYFTGTSHSPFFIPDEAYYTQKLKEHITPAYQDFFETYSKNIKTILFVDDALKEFFSEYQKRDDYDNTIFIITGDHPMTEMPRANSLKRFHVPLIIFSEQLKEHQEFSNCISHLDVPEALLSFLQDYIAYTPSISTSLGLQLLPQGKQQTQHLAFMNGNREVIDFLSGNYYLAGEQLYTVDSALNINKLTDDSIQSEMAKQLSTFQNMSLSVCRNNNVIPNDLFCKALNIKEIFSRQESDSLKTSSEYIPIIDKTTVSNIDFVFDISLNVQTQKKDNISIVYQISNAKDSTLLWGNLGINNDKITQAHIPIQQIPVSDSVLYFKAYIWNQHKRNLIISDIDVLLYESEPISNRGKTGNL